MLWCHAVVHFEVKRGRFSACSQDDGPRSLGLSPLCHVGLSNEGRFSSMATGLSNGCQWVFNEACLTLGCHL